MRRAVVVVAAALVCSGCFYRNDLPWEPIPRPYEWGGWFGPHFALSLPDGWIKLNDEDEGVVATRDGFGLQRIAVRRLKVGDDLANTKKKLRRGMSPQELAEVLIDDVRASGERTGVKVLETRPATLAGKSGFRATLAYTEDGLPRQEVLAGILVDDLVWRVNYVAPARHYFALDAKTFDEALESFRVW